MIIHIDDLYFNPLQVTQLTQDGNNVIVWFQGEECITFKNWLVYNLAAEINHCIEVFYNDKS